MGPFLEQMIDKYFDVDEMEFVPVEQWSGEDLASLEVMANGELQRRADDVVKLSH